MPESFGGVVRVRFAPSPTGYLHIGGARTALLNYLLARRASGKIFLRIEDTDTEREVAGALEALKSDLDWLGIKFDDWSDGQTIYTWDNPLCQSKRHNRYVQVVDELYQRGAIYKCWCSPERLAELRQIAARQNLPPRYDKRCLKMPHSTIWENEKSATPFVMRLKMQDKPVVIDDLFKGHITFAGRNLDDPILVRSDGTVTSLLAGVVDDHDMGITHILRGEEWLPSTPYQKVIFEALDWQVPRWGHLAMLLDASGHKLSKRVGNATIEEIRALGILPEALCRYVAGLGRNNFGMDVGWDMESLVQNFELTAYRSGNIIYSHPALLSENQHLIQRLSDSEIWDILKDLIINRYPQAGEWDFSKQTMAIALGRNGAKTIQQILENLAFVLAPPAVSKDVFLPYPQALEVITSFIDELSSTPPVWNSDSVKYTIDKIKERTKLKGADIYMPLRIALTGRITGPTFIDIMIFLGRDECLKRAKEVKDLLSD